MESTRSIDQGKQYINAHLEKGVNCPCCGHLNKAYKRKLTLPIVRILAYMYVETMNRHAMASQKQLPSDWRAIKVEPILDGAGLPTSDTADIGVLRWYGFISPEGHNHWLVNISVVHPFLLGTKSVPTWLRVYNKQVIKESKEFITSDEILSRVEIDKILSLIGPVLTVKDAPKNRIINEDGGNGWWIDLLRSFRKKK